MNTRTILVSREAFSDVCDTDDQIEQLVEQAAEAFFVKRDDVTSFRVKVRSEQYMTVQLPADYDAEESLEIRDTAILSRCEA